MLARTLLITGMLLAAVAGHADPPPAPLAAELVAANLHEFQYTADLDVPPRIWTSPDIENRHLYHGL